MGTREKGMPLGHLHLISNYQQRLFMLTPLRLFQKRCFCFSFLIKSPVLAKRVIPVSSSFTHRGSIRMYIYCHLNLHSPKLRSLRYHSASDTCDIAMWGSGGHWIMGIYPLVCHVSHSCAYSWKSPSVTGTSCGWSASSLLCSLNQGSLVLYNKTFQYRRSNIVRKTTSRYICLLGDFDWWCSLKN